MKGRILVVEDNLITSEVIIHQLKKLGYAVANVVTTGEEAVEWTAWNEADLILMDVQLDGDMDGVEAATIIRSRSEIPIVYLTANSDLCTIGRASETQASGYLPKPFDERSLHSTIQMALGRRRADMVTAETRALLARTLAALPQAVIAIDAAGAITSMNAMAEQLTGSSFNAAVGDDISRILHALNESGRDVVDEIPALFLTADLAPVRQTVTVVSSTGTRRAMEQVVSPILDETKRLTGIVIAFQDAPGSCVAY